MLMVSVVHEKGRAPLELIESDRVKLTELTHVGPGAMVGVSTHANRLN
jgi:hypothetical protein